MAKSNNNNYVLISADISNTLTIINIDCVDTVSELLKKCRCKEQLNLFESVTAKVDEKCISGKPLFVSGNSTS